MLILIRAVWFISVLSIYSTCIGTLTLCRSNLNPYCMGRKAAFFSGHLNLRTCQYVWVRLARQATFKSSTFWYVMAGKGLILNVTVHRKHFPLLLRRICIIDSKLFNDGRNEERYKSRRSGTTKQLTVIGIIWIINCVSNMYYFFDSKILNILFLSLRILCNIIFSLISCQYTSMVLLLRARYKIVNREFNISRWTIVIGCRIFDSDVA
jgi:hypothetical protein